MPQIYVGFPDLIEGNEPPVQLKAFQKVKLQPGETRMIHLVLGAEAFSFWSNKLNTWVLASGAFKIVLADSSANIFDSKQLILR